MNVLLESWGGPFGGVPPFDRVRVDDFKPALEAAMDEQLRDIERIASDPAPATFENTVAAMERGGRAFDRVTSIYGIFAGTMRSSAFQEVEREMEPKLAQFSDRIVQNERLFARIAAVYEARETSGLTPEQQRLAWLKHTEFARSGANFPQARCIRRRGGPGIFFAVGYHRRL